MPKAEELLAEADMLGGNPMSMAPEMYDIRARKQMMFQTRDSRQRRRR